MTLQATTIISLGVQEEQIVQKYYVTFHIERTQVNNIGYEASDFGTQYGVIILTMIKQEQMSIWYKPMLHLQTVLLRIGKI